MAELNSGTANVLKGSTSNVAGSSEKPVDSKNVHSAADFTFLKTKSHLVTKQDLVDMKDEIILHLRNDLLTSIKEDIHDRIKVELKEELKTELKLELKAFVNQEVQNADDIQHHLVPIHKSIDELLDMLKGYQDLLNKLPQLVDTRINLSMAGQEH